MTSMSAEEFRRYGRQVVDWIADYWSRVESLPVQSRARAGETRKLLPAHPPEHREPFEALLADLDRIVLPGVTHWQHPRFFGYFPANASGPAVLGDLISSGLGVQGMLWATSPACTELEQHVLDWLAELLGLPLRFRSDGPGGGVIQDTASSAVIVALAAALQRATAGAARQAGVAGGAGSGYAVYASAEAHSCVDKAVVITGLGECALRKVRVDRQSLALDPAHLRALVAQDQAAGVVPVMAVATVGTTSTTAIDPVRAIGEVCRIPLGRRFRALKLWAVIRWYGAEGLREHIRGHIRLAADFAAWVGGDDRFEVAAPNPLSLVCFRLRLPGRSPQQQDDGNLALMEQLNGSGEIFVTHTRIGSRVALRLAVGGTFTEQRHVEQAWERIRAAAEAI